MRALNYDRLSLFINGAWIDAGNRDTAPVINPANGAILGRVPLATAPDLDLALDTARTAFDVWRHTVPAERSRILRGAAALMRERSERIATLMTLEEGKPLAESRDEVLRAAEYFEWFSEERRAASTAAWRRRTAPACSNWSSARRSAPVGRLLSERAAAGVKPITLELGGHGPVLVFEDADIELAATGGAANRFRGTGQICISSTRFLIQRGAYNQFVEHFVAATRALVIGDGMAPQTQVGPLANARQLAKMEALVADALEQGATLLVGGKRLDSPGYYFAPTVLANVPMTARIMHEEPFGPIAVLMKFDTLADGLAEANRLPYALSAYAFTRDARTALDVGDGLEAGMIGINQYRIVATELPFGGMKESGHGSEGGAEGTAHYLTNKFISQA